MSEWVCDYTCQEQQLQQLYWKHISTYPQFTEVAKDLREELLTTSFFPHPCPTRAPSTSHREMFSTLLKCLASGCVFVTSPNWPPHTVGLRLVVPPILANMISCIHAIFWPSEKRAGTRLVFPLSSVATEELIYVTAATILMLSWSSVFSDQTNWGHWKDI